MNLHTMLNVFYVCAMIAVIAYGCVRSRQTRHLAQKITEHHPKPSAAGFAVTARQQREEYEKACRDFDAKVGRVKPPFGVK